MLMKIRNQAYASIDFLGLPSMKKTKYFENGKLICTSTELKTTYFFLEIIVRHTDVSVFTAFV